MGRVSRPVISDPPPALLQGVDVALFGLEDLPGSWTPDCIMNGPSIETPPEPEAPRVETMLWAASVQDKTFPMAAAGGDVFTLPIAKAKAKAKAVELAQAFMIEQQTVDNDGINEILPSVPEPNFDGRYTAGAGVETSFPAMTVPNPVVTRGNRFRDLPIAEITAPRGRADIDWTLANQAFYFVGTTKTGAGVALANCRVTLLDSSRLSTAFYTFGQDIVGQQVSDGSGNFSIQARNSDHMLMAYKDGSPELGGLTRDDVVPSTGISIYLRDPTVADSASSAAYRPVGSPVVRRVDL